MNTMRVLPFGKHKRQNVVVGDDTGHLLSFGIKRGEKKINFKTLIDSKEITHLCLSGKDGKDADKIFVSTDCDIHGVSKKGKKFFQVNSNMTESIENLCVTGHEIWTSGEYVFSAHKDSGEELLFYPCQDRINDFAVGKITSKSNEGVLGCADGSIRVVKGNDCVIQANVKYAVTTVKLLGKPDDADPFAEDGGDDLVESTNLVFGTRRGNLGCINLSHDGTAKKKWNIQRDKKYGAINCLTQFDMTKDGTNDFIVGREDGHVQVYSQTEDQAPELQFSSSVTESIRGVDVGVVSSPGFDEIILCTFSGRIVSFTSESMNEKDDGDKYGRSKGTVTKEAIATGLKADLKDLKSQVEKETKKFQKEHGGSKELNMYRAMEQQFKIGHTFDLVPEDAAYRLCIEAAAPIEQLMVQCDVPVEFLDVESNDAIVSVTPCHQDRSNGVLATYRNDEPQRRMELKVRTVEGQGGVIQVYVIASPEPKTAQIVEIVMHPLSLHSRLETPKTPAVELLQYSRNRLELRGFTSINKVNEWLRKLLPSFPRRQDGEESTLFYENSLTGSILSIEYEQQLMVLSSDSISTVTILKETINEFAMKGNQHISISIKVDDTSVVRFLNMIEPKLQYQLGLSTKMRWLDALKEITTGGGGTEYLAPELKDALKNEKSIRADFKNSAKVIKFWYGVITDLYIDLNRCRGVNVSHNIPHLLHALDNFNMQQVVQFFGVNQQNSQPNQQPKHK